MRRAWIVVALVATACAGGQTGEITELTACHEPIGVARVDDASAAGRSAREQLAELTTSFETELHWDEGRAPSTVTVSVALTEAPATLLGGPQCARPWLQAPVTVTLRTADGALDETIDGDAILADTGGATVQATIALSALDGALTVDDELDPQRAVLRIDLHCERDALGGEITLDPGTETAGYRSLASF